MAQRTLAKRYARALLQVAAEKNEIGRVAEDLRGVADAYCAVPELRLLVASPARSRDAKKAALARLFSGKVADVVLRFLAVVLEKKRFSAIEEIASAYDDLADEAQGIARARVTTFAPLGEAQRKALTERLGRLTDRTTVVLAESVDAEILGGIVVRIGDQVLDGSIRGRLRKLRERLIIREEDRATAAAAMAGEVIE